MPSLTKLLSKFRSKPPTTSEQQEQGQAEARRKHFLKYTIPIVLLAVYLIFPVLCIIIAGINLDHNDLDYRYYLDLLQKQHKEMNEAEYATQNVVASFFSSVVSSISRSQQEQQQQKLLEAMVRDHMCSRPLNLWLIIAGIAFLLNVPMVYLYQINLKLKKKEKKGIFTIIKNQVTSGTKKGVIGLIGLMAVVVQPFNFAWSVIGLIWIVQTTSNMYCSSILYAISVLKAVIMFISVFGHVYLLVSVIKQLKKSKDSSKKPSVVVNVSAVAPTALPSPRQKDTEEKKLK